MSENKMADPLERRANAVRARPTAQRERVVYKFEFYR